MRQLGLALALLALQVSAQTPQHRLFLQPNLPRSNLAFFEFAPASGAGMGANCACAAVTGAKGEALTFTRASSATCTKTNGGTLGGFATTGIANGDLVTCANDQPRIEYDGFGGLGILAEPARTNLQIQSAALDNAAYTDDAVGAAAPTLNGANTATDPFGTTTAEDYTFPATTAGQQSGRKGGNIASCVGANCVFSIYVRGQAGSGTLDLCSYGVTVGQCVACNFVSTSWTRCTTGRKVNATNAFFWIGNNTTVSGIARSSNRVFLFGSQVEAGANAFTFSYIPTTTVAVSTVQDGSLTLASMALQPPLCIGANITGPSHAIDGALGGGARSLISYANTWRLDGALDAARLTHEGVGVVTSAATTPVPPARYSGFVDGAGNVSACLNASCTSGALSNTTPASGTFVIGTTDNGPALGIVSHVVVDPSMTRCLSQ